MGISLDGLRNQNKKNKKKPELINFSPGFIFFSKSYY